MDQAVIIAMGGGPGGWILGIPVLGLAGLYFSETRALRVSCAIILGLWLLIFVGSAIYTGKWNILIWPGMAVIAWFWISEVKKSID